MRITRWLKEEYKETKRLLARIPAVLMTFFVLSLVMMNLLANKSINTGTSWLALDGGILVSWLTFLTMDITVKVYGPKDATRLSLAATVINLVVCLMFALAANISGLWSTSFVEEGEAINEALDATFGGTWYVLLGSTVAFIASAFVNSGLNWSIGKLFKKRPDGFMAYAARSYGSTMVAQFADNIIFALLVSLNFFGWSFLQCFTCALTGAVVELVCEIVFSPIGYLVAKRCQDTYGKLYKEEPDTQLNPSEPVTYIRNK